MNGRVIGWVAVYGLAVIVALQIGEIIRQIHPALAWISAPLVFLCFWKIIGQIVREMGQGG